MLCLEKRSAKSELDLDSSLTAAHAYAYCSVKFISLFINHKRVPALIAPVYFVYVEKYYFPQPSCHDEALVLLWMAMAADRISTKLSIQHPIAPDCQIVGILEQLSLNPSTHGRKIALVRAVFLSDYQEMLPDCVFTSRSFMERWGQHTNISEQPERG